MPTSKKTTSRKPKIVINAQQVNVNPIAIAKAGGSQIKGFLNFVRTQGVAGLAVGLVLGGAVTILVRSLVDNVVMPPLGLLFGSAEGIKGLSWTMGIAASGKPAILYYGTFLNDFVNFIVIALVVYVIVRLLKLDQLEKNK